MVVPRSALSASMAISGPGCGGTSPCSTDRPGQRRDADEQVGLAAVGALAAPARARGAAIVKMIGISSTTPISKNSGMPTIIATTAIAQGTLVVAAAVQDRGGYPLGPAGLGQQLAEHRAQREDDADGAERVAGAAGEGLDELVGRQAGQDAHGQRADHQREERVELEHHHEPHDREDRDHRVGDQQRVVPGPHVACGPGYPVPPRLLARSV